MKIFSRLIEHLARASCILSAIVDRELQKTQIVQQSVPSLGKAGGLPLVHADPQFAYQTFLSAPGSTPAPDPKVASNKPQPQEVYNGGYSNGSAVRLRIANGGAGQIGLVGEWANAFIQFMVQTRGYEPFQVAWYLGDTTDSLSMLEAGIVDVAATYNEAAESLSLASGAATRSVYAFRGYFALVGPKSNPAGLDPKRDNILAMLGKIAHGGKIDDQRPPSSSGRLPVRFLSRFDKSATNIRESELFLKIGQVPWALAYSRWYHQYPQFPQQALRAASLSGEYTLTDMATLISLADSDTSGILDQTVVFRKGRGNDEDDLLLNACHVLLGARAIPENRDIATAFLDWLGEMDGGRKVVREFGKNGTGGFSEPP